MRLATPAQSGRVPQVRSFRRALAIDAAGGVLISATYEIDRLRPCPKVSIIGEFWAMTTEGDGNYALQRFLATARRESPAA